MAEGKRTLAAGLVAAIVAVAPAAQFREFDRREQVLGSDVIAVGRVVGTRSDREDAGEAIFTAIDLLVDEAWKGAPEGEVIEVRSPGGEVDGVALEVDGAARFVEGERVLVFLRWKEGYFEPWGMRYGKYRIEEDAEPPFAVGALPTGSPGSGRFEAVSQSLEDLEREVREILEAVE